MPLEELFYFLAPAFKNQPAIKLECIANYCADTTLFDAGYYEFSIVQEAYESYYEGCDIKTFDEQGEFFENLSIAMAIAIETKYGIIVDDPDGEQGFWRLDVLLRFVFSYIYYEYEDSEEEE